jgi:hypothetical protein
MSYYAITEPEPAQFPVMDPDDVDSVIFDWSQRSAATDRITFASVVSIPAGLTVGGVERIYLGGGYLGIGNFVECIIGPCSAAAYPATFLLRCTCYFASGRVSSYSVPITIRPL